MNNRFSYLVNEMFIDADTKVIKVEKKQSQELKPLISNLPPGPITDEQTLGFLKEMNLKDNHKNRWAVK